MNIANVFGPNSVTNNGVNRDVLSKVAFKTPESTFSIKNITSPEI